VQLFATHRAAVATAEVVQHHRPEPGPAQRLDHVRTDVAGAAGDQDGVRHRSLDLEVCPDCRRWARGRAVSLRAMMKPADLRDLRLPLLAYAVVALVSIFLHGPVPLYSTRSLAVAWEMWDRGSWLVPLF